MKLIHFLKLNNVSLGITEQILLKSLLRLVTNVSLLRRFCNLWFRIEDMKSILIYDLFYYVALNIARPLPETFSGNKCVLVAIGHYFKWCEARLVKNHDAMTTTKFFEEKVVC